MVDVFKSFNFPSFTCSKSSLSNMSSRLIFLTKLEKSMTNAKVCRFIFLTW